MGDDQLRVRVGVDEAREVVGDRRQPAPPWIRIGTRRSAASAKTGQPLVVQQEALRARVQLDPARAQVETAFGLADGVFRQVEPHERDKAALGALAVLEVRSFGARNPGAGRARPCRT